MRRFYPLNVGMQQVLGLLQLEDMQVRARALALRSSLINLRLNGIISRTFNVRRMLSSTKRMTQAPEAVASELRSAICRHCASGKLRSITMTSPL